MGVNGASAKCQINGDFLQPAHRDTITDIYGEKNVCTKSVLILLRHLPEVVAVMICCFVL